LQLRLQTECPTHNSEHYVTTEDVLKAKLETLQSQGSLQLPAAPPNPQLARSDNEQLEVQDDEVLEHSKDIDEPRYFFPAVIEYLDFSSLGLSNPPPRLPLPLLLREEYRLLSSMIDPLPKRSQCSVMVSGQPGIGTKLYISISFC
jgi:hypothetical protein